jgi:hypothetical protein
MASEDKKKSGPTSSGTPAEKKSGPTSSGTPAEKKTAGKGSAKAAPEKASAKAPAAKTTTAATERYRLPRDGGWARAWQYAAVLGGVGVVGSLIAWNAQPERFAFSWLFAFMTFLAIGLGSLFIVIVQHLAGAGWSVTLRRTSEFFAAGLPVFFVLFLPIAYHMDALYPWMHYYRESLVTEPAAAEPGDDAEATPEEHSTGEAILGASTAFAQDHDGEGDHHASASHHGAAHEHTPEHAAHEATITAKLAFLNQPFFLLRAAVYFALWTLLSLFFFGSSTSQDSSRDKALTRKMQSWSPLAMFGLALSLTFAAVDWMMSLEPTWFSTIFGVQYFAVSAVSGLSTLVLVTYLLRNAGLLGEAVTVEHFHDIGKLLFGFLVFWAYISFSQFMLIWYASIPEETTYYHLRENEGWWTFSLFMGVCHFFVPFFALISRNVKRRVSWLAVGAGWLLAMHVVEVYWLVMPYSNGGAGLDVHWMDLAALFAVGGTYLAVVFFRMSQHPLIPVGDPRLDDALHHEVT